jgi:hypothetical protein
LLDALKKVCADVNVKFAIQFANASGAGNVDFSDVITDYIDPHKQQAAPAQLGTDLLA